MTAKTKNTKTPKEPVNKRTGPRQRRTRFVREYLIDHNATRAAKAAGYSEKTAGQAGARLLKDVKIAEMLDAENQKVNDKLEITVERVKKELARLAFYDPRKFFKADGSLLPVDQLDDDTAMALAGMDVNELFDGNGEDRAQVGYSKKVKLVDKLEALVALGRHLKMFTDRVEVNADGALIARLIEGRRRVAQAE
jgi:phage terminase small subunit